MLQRRAVPAFKNKQYGFGIYNVVMAVADRLRDVQHGEAHPYYRSSSITNSNNDTQGGDAVWVILIVLGAIGAAFSCACCIGHHDAKYPMGQGYRCPGKFQQI